MKLTLKQDNERLGKQNRLLKQLVAKVGKDRDRLYHMNQRLREELPSEPPKWCAYEKKKNDKHVKDALGHLRKVQKGFMGCRRWGRVVAALCELEEWEKLP